MNGTYDQAQAFFAGIRIAWLRVSLFFILSWAAFGFGFIAATTLWTSSSGLRMDYGIEEWYVFPLVWLFKSAASFLDWWGLPRFLFLAGIGYLQFYTQINLCRLSCLLFLEECWFWWASFSILPRFKLGLSDVIDYFGDWDTWHPFAPLLFAFTLFGAWLWRWTWKKEYPSPFAA